ncbi:hypothetical protein FISHEDRAFT_65340 [Fistulina hepatica ATCC 64428]|nr:hypothetical protein FISHEDRAFT_65340 [Fistulina hepatica ATCC 64428]
MVFLVLDTNILLHYFDVLKTFAQNIERLAIPIVLLIPGQVIYELDKQKDMQDMKWNARRASSWLLEQLQKGGKGAKFKYIRGQATRETCKASGNWKVLNGPDTNYTSDMKKDENILDCCMYFRRQHVTVLCSNDNNLCILAQNENSERQHGEHDLSVIKPPKQKWSSQQLMAQLARLIPFNISSLSGFNTTDSHYKNLESIREEEEIVDDSMDVDDDSTLTAEIMQPTDAADSLHLEVVGHFSILLRQLVARVAKDEIINLPKTPSRHAPKWHVSLGHAGTDDWTASDCIDFFEDKKKPGDVRWSRVRSFLSPPYSRTVRGTRPGKDWSRMDWTEVLRALQKIGEAWDEPTFDQSVGILEPHFTAVMDRVLRP